MDSYSLFPSVPTTLDQIVAAYNQHDDEEMMILNHHHHHHHHNNDNSSCPPSPPTVLIPSSSQTSLFGSSCSEAEIQTSRNASDDDDEMMMMFNTDMDDLMMPSPILAATVTHTTTTIRTNNSTTTNNTTNGNCGVANVGEVSSPRTPRLRLDPASIIDEWTQLMNNNTTSTCNHTNMNMNNNNNNNNSINTLGIDCDQIQQLLNQLSVNTPTIHANGKIVYNNNNNNMMINTNAPQHQSYHTTPSSQYNNNNNNNTTQAYLGSVRANCTNIHQCISPSNNNMKHVKSPSMGSSSIVNGSTSRGIKKPSHMRSNSACFQSVQSFMVGSATTPIANHHHYQSMSSSLNHLGLVSNNGGSVGSVGGSFSLMNGCGGLNSPSVSSTCSSSATVTNQTVSPANISTNSFATVNNGCLMNNNYCFNNNQQYSQIVNNQQGVNSIISTSQRKGKIPGHRQDKFNGPNPKGLLIDANPNDKPVKMKQKKVKDPGFQIQIEDGINKNKKETGLQFHTCTFQQ